MRRFALLALVAATVSTGCGEFPGLLDGGWIQQDSITEDIIPYSDSSAVDAVVGHYVTKATMATVQQAPIVGRVGVTSTVYGLTELYRDENGELLGRESGCRIDVQTDQSFVRTTIADAVPQSIPPMDARYVIWWSEDGQLRWRRQETVSAVGADMSADMDAPLPTSPSDPRVIDQDGDGKPGVTLKVRASIFVRGEVYAVQRQRISYHSGHENDGVLQANISSVLEQKVIDASSSMLKVDLPTINDPDGSRSIVTLRPVDEALDCDGLLNRLGEFF